MDQLHLSDKVSPIFWYAHPLKGYSSEYISNNSATLNHVHQSVAVEHVLKYIDNPP